MKRILLVTAAIAMLCALPGCNNRTDETMLNPVQDRTLQPMPQSWRGVVPCADCSGIERSLFLERDGTWVMNERYLDAPSPTTAFASYGTWARTAEKLVLTSSTGDKAYYQVKGDKLEMLDMQGNPINSSLNYTLTPVKASLPVTPMAMRGMYFYMADAATFTDCATGKRIAVANNAQLERDYAVARGESMKPVLLVVEGHFTQEPNPDTGEQVKTLATDKSGKFMPGKGCGD